MAESFSHLLAFRADERPLAPEGLDDTRCQFRDSVRAFAREHLAPHTPALETLDLPLTRRLLDDCAAQGLCAIDIPEVHGGLELGWVTAVASSEWLAECRSASFMVSLGAVTGIGLLPILLYGTADQQARWLPAIADGRLKGAYALTEPGSGSDALAADCRAEPVPGGWCLTGRKQYISNAGFADYFIVFAQAPVRDGGGTRGLAAFLVARDTAGLSVGPEEHKLGLKGSSTAALVLEQAVVPEDSLLGRVGEGPAIALCTLDLGRLKLGFMDLGFCRLALADALRYTEDRRQFGVAIAGLEAIQGKLAGMAVHILALESLAWRVLGLLEARMHAQGPRAEGRRAAAVLEGLALETSLVKILGSESLFQVADQALQCLGGYGFIEDYGLARVARDTRVDRIFEGTNEINRQVVLGQLLKGALEGTLDLVDGDPGSAAPEAGDTAFAGAVLNALRAGLKRLLDRAITAWGQDLALHQQAGEDLADLALAVYALDSALLRVIHHRAAFRDRAAGDPDPGAAGRRRPGPGTPLQPAAASRPGALRRRRRPGPGPAGRAGPPGPGPLRCGRRGGPGPAPPRALARGLLSPHDGDTGSEGGPMTTRTVIVDALRTPIGLKNGPLVPARIDGLCADLVRGLLARHPGLAGLAPDDLVLGCAFPEGVQGMLAGPGSGPAGGPAREYTGPGGQPLLRVVHGCGTRPLPGHRCGGHGLGHRRRHGGHVLRADGRLQPGLPPGPGGPGLLPGHGGDGGDPGPGGRYHTPRPGGLRGPVPRAGPGRPGGGPDRAGDPARAPGHRPDGTRRRTPGAGPVEDGLPGPRLHRGGHGDRGHQFPRIQGGGRPAAVLVRRLPPSTVCPCAPDRPGPWWVSSRAAWVRGRSPPPQGPGSGGPGPGRTSRPSS
jgi:alkylation response protein AidB-like acyl-CoA dehydrogenase